MDWKLFLIILVIISGSILIFRVAPLFLMGERKLSEESEHTLNLIPVAAFAALVLNDLLPSFSSGPIGFDATLPFLAAIPTIIVAIKTKSLAWCVVVGVGAYALLYFLF